MEAPFSDMRKRALDALEERFKAAKVKQDQVDQSNSSACPQKDLVNPSSPAQLASSQKGMVRWGQCFSFSFLKKKSL